LRHEYDDVDPAVIWRIIRGGELESLKNAILNIVAQLRRSQDNRPREENEDD
jgi:uncharacterized protein with HEPN domain